MTNFDTLVVFNVRKNEAETQPLYAAFSNVHGFNSAVADGLQVALNADENRAEAVFEIIGAISELRPERIGISLQAPDGIKHTVTYVDFETSTVSLLDYRDGTLKVQFDFEDFIDQFETL